MMPVYELESVDALPPRERTWPPPLAERQAVGVNDQVRLMVFINGRTTEFPWVTVTHAQGSRYTGRSCDDYGGRHEEDVIPHGTEFAFGPEHIIEI